MEKNGKCGKLVEKVGKVSAQQLDLSLSNLGGEGKLKKPLFDVSGILTVKITKLTIQFFSSGS